MNFEIITLIYQKNNIMVTIKIVLIKSVAADQNKMRSLENLTD